jgi:hypothetical protein
MLFSCRLAQAALVVCLGFLVSARALALGIVYPVYTENQTQFNAVYAAMAKVPVLAVINPLDGPGTVADAALVTFSANVRNGNSRVLGYIDTNYGGTTVTEVSRQMRLYETFYNVDGFFFDEVEDIPVYNGSIAAEAQGRLTFFNPGTNISADHNPFSSVIATYENPLGGSFSAPFLSYESNLKNSGTQSAAIVYGVSTQAKMVECVDRAILQGYDWLYITHDVEPNPFDAIPTYWTAEVNYITSKRIDPPLSNAAFTLSKPQHSGSGWRLDFATAIGRSYEIQVSTNLATWTTAVQTASGSAARVQATTTSSSLVVNGLSGATGRGYFRVRDTTP